MKTVSAKSLPLDGRACLTALWAAALLSACGGGTAVVPTEAAPLASSVTTLQLDVPVLPQAIAEQMATPSFHVAPVLLDAPDDADAAQNNASAHAAPRRQAVPPEAEGLTSRRLTVDILKAAREKRLASDPTSAPDGTAAPMATGGVIATYTPAQIRAAYGLPSLPATGATLSAAQAAQLGAGQTIYIVDAQHNPNVATELAAFNTKFGLPGCTTKAIATTAGLPLAAASAGVCELSVVYGNASGGMNAAAPAFDAGWSTEISLDVQWVHATAPLARMVLIEVPDASLNSLLGGIKLANAMGPGIVSMSFGAVEGSWTASVDSVFSSSKMTYVAAAGDSGASVSWPAVSPNVVAVGGTTLTYSGAAARSEVGWAKTGGGTSAFTSAPAYQTSAVPGMGAVTRRNVPDVAFNADATTGQYVAVMTPGSSTVNWISAGGTSLSAPQWAGLVAVGNAMRLQAGKAILGAPHAVLYGQIATVPGTYASTFADITKGSNGTCTTCTARIGYDPLTGLGTPNGSSLLTVLTGASAPVAAPVVTPASISGVVGTALSFTVSVTAPNGVAYALSGAPAGMSVSAAGVVTWAAPVAGSYSVTVTAKDSTTGLSGQGVYTVTIAAPQAPTVGTATVSGKPGVALSFAVTFTAPNPVTYTLSGAPAGMSISSTGVVSWASPVLGNYTVTVSAKDTKTGLTGQGVYTVRIATAGPVITAPAITGVAGKPLSGTIGISASGATSLSVSITGVPLGVVFSVSGTNLTAYWANPVTGNYTMTVSVVDSAGLSAKATVPITVAAK